MGPLPPFEPHLDVVTVVASLAFGYWYLDHRTRPLLAPMASPASLRQRVAWFSGLAVLFGATWWPMHDLAEQTLFTAHMIEHLLIGYVVPPLLLIGTPRWLADATLGRHAGIMRHVLSPVVGFFAFNTAIVAIHWPQAIAWQNASPALHVAAHAVMFFAGIAMWTPVFSPTPAIPRLRPPMRMMYLFLNTIVPTVPASFLTFSPGPLFPSYGDAAMSWGLSPVADQTIGGVVMKLGAGFYLLAIIAWIWVRWTREEREWDRLRGELVDSSR